MPSEGDNRAQTTRLTANFDSMYLTEHVQEGLEVSYGETHVVGNLQQLLAGEHCRSLLCSALCQAGHKGPDLEYGTGHEVAHTQPRRREPLVMR